MQPEFSSDRRETYRSTLGIVAPASPVSSNSYRQLGVRQSRRDVFGNIMIAIEVFGLGSTN